MIEIWVEEWVAGCVDARGKEVVGFVWSKTWRRRNRQMNKLVAMAEERKDLVACLLTGEACSTEIFLQPDCAPGE